MVNHSLALVTTMDMVTILLIWFPLLGQPWWPLRLSAFALWIRLILLLSLAFVSISIALLSKYYDFTNVFEEWNPH